MQPLIAPTYTSLASTPNIMGCDVSSASDAFYLTVCCAIEGVPLEGECRRVHNKIYSVE